MIARRHPEALEVGGEPPGLVMQLRVGDHDRVAAYDEGEVVAEVCAGLDPLREGQHGDLTRGAANGLQAVGVPTR